MCLHLQKHPAFVYDAAKNIFLSFQFLQSPALQILLSFQIKQCLSKEKNRILVLQVIVLQGLLNCLVTFFRNSMLQQRKLQQYWGYILSMK